MNVLARITQLRQKRGWTEYELAKRSGLPQSTISTWYCFWRRCIPVLTLSIPAPDLIRMTAPVIPTAMIRQSG